MIGVENTAHSGVVQALLKQQFAPGAVIRIARTAAGWSQADLGQRCGYSASQISRWETGRMPLVLGGPARHVGPRADSDYEPT